MELKSSLTSSNTPRGTVLLSHGLGEHHARYVNIKDALNEAGYDVWFRDFTGHGEASPGGPNPTVDVAELIGEHLEARKELEKIARSPKIYLLGHSMGGLVTLASALLNPHHIEAVAVSGPALRPLPKLPLFVAKIGQAAGRVFPFLKTVEIDSSLTSRDPEVVESYKNDPMVYQGKVPLLTGASMFVQGDQVIRNAAILSVPVLIIHGGDDGLADVQGSIEFANAAPEGSVRVEVVDALHEVLNEKEHPDYEKTIIDFYNEHN